MPRGCATWLPEDRLPQRYRGFPPILLEPPERSQLPYHIGHRLALVVPSTSIRGLQMPSEAVRGNVRILAWIAVYSSTTERNGLSDHLGVVSISITRLCMRSLEHQK